MRVDTSLWSDPSLAALRTAIEDRLARAERDRTEPAECREIAAAVLGGIQNAANYGCSPANMVRGATYARAWRFVARFLDGTDMRPEVAAIDRNGATIAMDATVCPDCSERVRTDFTCGCSYDYQYTLREARHRKVAQQRTPNERPGTQLCAP